MSIERIVDSGNHGLMKHVKAGSVELTMTAEKIIKSIADDNRVQYKVWEQEQERMNRQHIKQTNNRGCYNGMVAIAKERAKKTNRKLDFSRQRPGTQEKLKNDKNRQRNQTCRSCKRNDKTVSHLISERNKITPAKYKHGQNNKDTNN